MKILEQVVDDAEEDVDDSGVGDENEKMTDRRRLVFLSTREMTLEALLREGVSRQAHRNLCVRLIGVLVVHCLVEVALQYRHHH